MYHAITGNANVLIRTYGPHCTRKLQTCGFTLETTLLPHRSLRSRRLPGHAANGAIGTTHPVWYEAQLSIQQSPPSSLVIVSLDLNCCDRLLASMSDSLQRARYCSASRHTQTWLTHNGLKTLASTTDTMMTADLLPKICYRHSGSHGHGQKTPATLVLQKC